MKKIVLIGQQGVGTNLLRAFLNSHPNIEFFGELFAVNRKFGIYYNKPVKENLDKFFNQDTNILGFDLKYNQITNEIKQYVLDNNIAVIHLTRDRGRTYLKSVNEKDLHKTFKYGNIINHSKRVKTCEEMIRNNFSNYEYLEITYEDMTRGKEIKELPLDFEKRIITWLGVNYKRLSIETKHLFLQNGLVLKY